MLAEPPRAPSGGEEPNPGRSAQVFLPRANLFFRAFLIGAPVLLLAGGFTWYRLVRSPVLTGVTMPLGQPVLFSHRHHAGELKIDCRYCHTSVTKSAFAGVPPTETCMTCHSQVFADSPLLAPVRQSMVSGEPIRWNRVHDVPDYVYFNHAIHVSKGVGCSTCHGPVDKMALVAKNQTLFMSWCLDCHRQPQAKLRPEDRIFDQHWQSGSLVAKNVHLDTAHLTNCSVCHE